MQNHEAEALMLLGVALETKSVYFPDLDNRKQVIVLLVLRC